MIHGTARPAEAPFDYHTMMQLPRQQIADAAHLALDRIQNLSPEEQVAGVATLFACIAERCQMNANELFLMGQRVMAREEDFHKRTNDSLAALRNYAALRIKGDANVSIS